MVDISALLLSALTRTILLVLSCRTTPFFSLWSAGFQAGAVHFNMNIEQIKEDYFLLFNDSRIKCIRSIDNNFFIQDSHCAPGITRTPPLLMAFFRPLLIITNSFGFNSNTTALVQYISVGIFMILIDSCIALTLERIGDHLITYRMEEEAYLQEIMDPRIAPPYDWVFGFSSNINENTDSNSKQQQQTNNTQGDSLHSDHTTHEGNNKKDRKRTILPVQSLPALSCRLYCCNPIILFTSFFSITTHGSNNISLQSIQYLLVLLAMLSSMKKGTGLLFMTFYMALATCINGSVVIYYIPMLLFYMNQNLGPAQNRFLVTMMATYFVLVFLGFHGLGQRFNFPHTTTNSRPNIGLVWYFNTQIFPGFRPFYQILHLGVPFVCVLPLFLRLKPYPWELVR